ncbi:S49 family peptidase, partial [Escherichia coli]
MTHLAHIATRLFNTPLLLTPEYASVVTSVLSD